MSLSMARIPAVLSILLIHRFHTLPFLPHLTTEYRTSIAIIYMRSARPSVSCPAHHTLLFSPHSPLAESSVPSIPVRTSSFPKWRFCVLARRFSNHRSCEASPSFSACPRACIRSYYSHSYSCSFLVRAFILFFGAPTFGMKSRT